MSIRKLAVGDSLWHMWRGFLSDCKVVRVGRIYAHTDLDVRIRLKTMMDEYGHQYYVSLDEYDRAVALKTAWNDLRIVIDSLYHRPSHLALADIYHIINLVQEANKL